MEANVKQWAMGMFILFIYHNLLVSLISLFTHTSDPGAVWLRQLEDYKWNILDKVISAGTLIGL